MREIKFRAKQLNDNNWISGYGVIIGDGFCAIPYAIRGNTHDWKLTTITCDINTLGQYTGLKDKNSKEIYEGDIILWRNEKYVVKFLSGMFYASVEEFNKDVYGGFPLWSLVEYHDEPDCGVIVGNIYEYKEEEK